MAAAALWTFQPSALQRYTRRFKRPSKTHIAALFFAIFLIQRIRSFLGLRAVSHHPRNAMPPAEIPGFTALTDQIYVREPAAAVVGADGNGAVLPEEDSSNHPDVVMVYGWGDGLPKHVAKYTDGFRVLFPRAKQIICLSPIAKAMFSEHQQRSESMMPIIKAIFPEGSEKQGKLKILAHTMSNTGAVNYASMLNIYQQTHNAPFPHDLLIMDSTPGSTDFTRDNLVRWSRAMALGTANWFPWPFAVTQSIWAVSLCINWAIGKVKGTESAGAWSRKNSNNTEHATKDARRLYMYSKEDDLIGWEDIVSHAAESRRLGWEADVEAFEGSGHVGHMRKHTDQYWKAILDSWERAVAVKAA